MVKWMSLSRGTKQLKPLAVDDMEKAQNEVRTDLLSWNRSRMVVESLENLQYMVKMDGSGRITLRKRWYIRLIYPFNSVSLSCYLYWELWR